MSGVLPGPWSANTAETTHVLTWETESVPRALRLLADTLDDNPQWMLVAFYNSAAEPHDSWLSIVQAVVSYLPEDAS